jgi:hypothetical protein
MRILTVIALLAVTHCATHTSPFCSIHTKITKSTISTNDYHMSWAERYSWLTKRSLTD